MLLEQGEFNTNKAVNGDQIPLFCATGSGHGGVVIILLNFNGGDMFVRRVTSHETKRILGKLATKSIAHSSGGKIFLLKLQALSLNSTMICALSNN